MEARTKIIAAVAVIMMCAAGLVGAGYAYTASTVNNGNSAGAEYLTLVQGSTGAYGFADGTPAQDIYWDSSDFADKTNPQSPVFKTKYTLADAVDKTSIVGYAVVKLGDTFTLNPTFSATTNLPAITIDIGATNIAAITYPTEGTIWVKATDTEGSQYFLITDGTNFIKHTTPGTPAAQNDGITVHKNQEENAYLPITIELFYGVTNAAYNTGYVVTHAAGAVGENLPQVDIIGANGQPTTLTFSINVDKSNPGIVLDQYVLGMSLAAGTPATLTATLKGGWTGSISWVSGDDNIVTVDAGVVTAHATGNTTVTASVTIDGVVYTAVCAVTVEA